MRLLGLPVERRVEWASRERGEVSGLAIKLADEEESGIAEEEKMEWVGENENTNNQ